MKGKILVIFIILFSISACKKQIDKDRPEFIGKWYACVGGAGGCEYFVILTINDKSDATYHLYWEGNDHDYKGTARANDKHFKIGRINSFDIIEYPHKIDTAAEKKYVANSDGITRLANWKMILYGMKPIKWHEAGNYTYYKADY